VLIEIDGLRVLTDPVWGPRASPSRWAGPRRFQPVPVPVRSLPELDWWEPYEHPQRDLTIHPAWGHIHLGPENALEAWALLGRSAFLPVHWGTFSLAMHAWDEPAHAERVESWWRSVERRDSGRIPGEAPEAATAENLPAPVD